MGKSVPNVQIIPTLMKNQDNVCTAQPIATITNNSKNVNVLQAYSIMEINASLAIYQNILIYLILHVNLAQNIKYMTLY